MTMSGARIHIAVPSSETSISDGSPVRSRRKSAAAIPPATVMPPAESPNAARCMIGRGGAGRRQRVRDAAARPERRGVVAALLGVRAARALAVAAHVDDARVHGTDVLDARCAACVAPAAGSW